MLGWLKRISAISAFFIAILIEHYAGKWPFWLSPRQVCIATVSDKVNDWAEKVEIELKLHGYQVTFDRSPATLQKKVRNAQLDQYNFVAVIGQEEVAGKCVDIRSREGERIGKYTIDKLIEYFKTLEPKPSKKALELLAKVKGDIKLDTLDEYEQKLKYNLYLNGDELAEEDKKAFETVKSVDIDKEKYPNVFKWKKLVATQLK